MQYFTTAKNFVLAHRLYSAIAAALLIVTIALLVRFLGEDSVASSSVGPRAVKVATISQLMGAGSTLSVVGNIESRNEAEIRTETGGRITRVSATLGQSVRAGQVLAEIENSAQRAAVLQAEGAYDAAKASLAKIQGGTRDEQLAILQSAQTAAKSGAVNALLGAYATADSAITDMADQMISNPTGSNPQFNVSTADSQAKRDIENARTALAATLARYETLTSTLTTESDLAAELSKTEVELRALRVFVDSIIKALNAAVSSPSITDATIAGYKAEAAATRSAISGSLSAIAGAKNGLEVAQKNLEQGVSGAQSEDVAAVEAQVKQTQGVYNAALSNLEKTVIRSPISGSLNNFSLKLGDFVSPSQQVAVVSNNGALEAITYVTEEDKATITVGNTVRIEGGLTGTITRIAPALDPISRRIEVRIGLPSEASTSIVNGQSVRLELDRSTAVSAARPTKIVIPIAALKMEADRNLVFTVDADNKLVARPITIGKLSGETLEVLDGLSADTEIVADARGLKEGDVINPQR